jgi:hypothetical protein
MGTERHRRTTGDQRCRFGNRVALVDAWLEGRSLAYSGRHPPLAMP